MRTFSRLQKRLFALGSVVVILMMSFFAPLLACPQCLGAGKLTVMESHPEAMGSKRSSTGALTDVGCPECDGKTRVTLYHRVIWEPPTLSSR